MTAMSIDASQPILHERSRPLLSFINMSWTCRLLVPGFAGGGFVALAGRGHAVAGCAPGIAHPAGQHTFSEAAHTPVGNTDVSSHLGLHQTRQFF